MNRSPRPGLVWLLLFVLAIGTAVEARATTATYNITLNWPGNVTTFGQFTLTTDITNQIHYLNNWNVGTPFVGSFQSGADPGSSGMALIPLECSTTSSCWEVQLAKQSGTFTNVLFLYFTGSVYNYNGGPVVDSIRVGNELLVSHLDCLDPQPNVEPFNSCTGEIPPEFIPPPPPPVFTPEPSSLALLASGLLGGSLSARWLSRHRRTR